MATEQLANVTLPLIQQSPDGSELVTNASFQRLSLRDQRILLQATQDCLAEPLTQEFSAPVPVNPDYHLLRISSDTCVVYQPPKESGDVGNEQAFKDYLKNTMRFQFKILHELGEGVLIVDKTKKIVFANPAVERLLGLQSYEVMGKEFAEFVTPEEEQERVREEIRRSQLFVQSFRFETQVVCFGDTPRTTHRDDRIPGQRETLHVLAHFSTLTSQYDKEVEGTLVTLYDITDIRELTQEIQERSEELFHAEKLVNIGLLASGVAHELNNPLSFILSNTATLKSYAEDLLTYLRGWEEFQSTAVLQGDQELREEALNINRLAKELDIDLIREDLFVLIDANQRGLNRLVNVVNDLRTFSHSAENVTPEQMSILEPIRTALNLLSYELKSIEVEFIDDSDPYSPIVGTTKLYQVFLNILHNAIQAIREGGEGGGKITIKTSELRNRVRVQISDNGVGVPVEKLPRLFDPFFTTKPPGVGTGLGLSIAQRIVLDHGGVIQVSSRGVGQGTTFTLFFPKGDNDSKMSGVPSVN